MRPPVAAAAVPVAPPVVRGQEVGEGGEQVVVRARPRLDDRDAGGGVRDEHVEEPVAELPHEVRALVGEVEDDVLTTGSHLQGVRLHEISSQGS